MTREPMAEDCPLCPYTDQCRADLVAILFLDPDLQARIAKRARCSEPRPDLCEVKLKYDAKKAGEAAQ